MKTNKLRITSIILALLPFVAEAQQSIIDAFDAIRNCKGAKIEESHYLQRNPETGLKIGQSDVYDFTLPKNKINLIEKAVRAINDNSDTAYSISSGEKSSKGRDVVLAVGDGKGDNVVLTTPECHYIYACFLAPKEEDPDGTYRYAYAISYDDFDGEIDGEIDGRLVITYATTMKHRQDNSRLNPVRELNKAETWTYDAKGKDGKDPWFRVFMKYVTTLGYSNDYTRPTNAGYLYEVTSAIGNYPNVTEKDKETAREILNTLINDKTNSNPVVQQILKSSIENLK